MNSSPNSVYAAVATALFIFFFESAFAQNDNTNGSSPNTGSGSPQIIDMRQPAPGDHWTYEVRDEIAGTIKRTRTDLITEVLESETTVRANFSDTGRTSFIVYDRLWNIKSDGTLRYTPNSGSGVHLPLVPGNTWKFTADEINSNTGATWKHSGSSKVVGRESVSTKAGAFEAFVIETNFVNRGAKPNTQLALGSVWTSITGLSGQLLLVRADTSSRTTRLS
jgi:hypothetical protein